MSTTIDSVTVQDAQQRIKVTVTTSISVDHFTLVRHYAGVTESVRGDDATEPYQFPASGATRSLFDVEAPRGVPVTYIVTAVTAAGVTESSTESAPVEHDELDCDWWIAPLSLPRIALAFEPESQSSQEFLVANGVFRPIGRADPIITFGTRSTASGSLTARGDSYVDAEAIREVVGRPEVLVVRAPVTAGWGTYGRRYVAFDSIGQARIANVPVSPYSVVLPWLEVVPANEPVTGFGATYQDVLDGFATYTAVGAAFASYDAMLAWVP